MIWPIIKGFVAGRKAVTALAVIIGIAFAVYAVRHFIGASLSSIAETSAQNGAANERSSANIKVIENVQKANNAVVVRDDDRDKRLRGKNCRDCPHD
jgi:hypothetical protein